MGKKGSVKDIVGRVFGRLTVIRFVGRAHRNTLWECQCSCGNTCVASKAHLGTCTNSCGCLKRENSAAMCRTHGQTQTVEYQTWSWMKSRCYNPNNKRYADWGGRGIRVCDQWLHSFENFLADMGPRPSSEYSIDRIDNDGNYEPKNCRWALRGEQSRNRSNNVLITHQGETLNLAAWAERKGIQQTTLSYRLKTGWTTDAALTTPVNTHRAPRLLAR